MKKEIETFWVIRKSSQGVFRVEQFANELNTIKYVNGILTTSNDAISIIKGTNAEVLMQLKNDMISFVTNECEIKSKYHKVILNAKAQEKTEAWKEKHIGFKGEAKQYIKEVRSK